MAVAAVPHSPLLRRLADDLDAETVESRLTPSGELIAEMSALGHRFRFRIAASGAIVERSCHSDSGDVLSQPELGVLRDLAEAELARTGHRHLNPDRHGSEVFAILARAEIKMSIALSGSLTGFERNTIARALEQWATDLQVGPDLTLRGEVDTAISAIMHKLGL